MKTIIAAATTAVALFALSGKEPAEAGSICPSYAKMAGTIMAARQAGVPQTTVLRAIVNAGEDNVAKEYAILTVQRAYLRPRPSSASARQRAVENFRNIVEAECYDVLAE